MGIKATILTGLGALLIGCDVGLEVQSSVEPDTVYVPYAVTDTIYQGQDYSFNVTFISRKHSEGNGWRGQAVGKVYNESSKEIIGLKPKLKMYSSLKEMDSDEWLTSNLGQLADSASIRSNDVLLFGITDTIPINGWKRHFTSSDTLPMGIVGYYRFGFEYPDSLNKKVMGKYIEGKIEKNKIVRIRDSL